MPICTWASPLSLPAATIVAGISTSSANPSPHLYLLDSVGSTDNWSLLIGHSDWTAKLREGAHPAELSTEDTARQIADTAHLGTRVLWLGWNLTAANTQWIITRAHQLGLVTYGEFISTPIQSRNRRRCGCAASYGSI